MNSIGNNNNPPKKKSEIGLKKTKKWNEMGLPKREKSRVKWSFQIEKNQNQVKWSS